MKNSNSKHTPGPWRIVPVKNEYKDKEIWGGGYKIATLTGGYDHEKQDARLISAAPELLAALEGLLKVVEAEPEACGIYKAHTEAARAAIAKAKGDK